MKLFLCTSLFFCSILNYAQSKPFVPLEYEYPESVLNSPKTYVYKNIATAELSFKDITLSKKQNTVIVIWKEYDDSPLIDSSIEVNDKGMEHYLIMNGQLVKAVVTEDSLYSDGSRLGEKRQSEYFNVNSSLTISAAIKSRFFKDTTLDWQGKTVSCIVVQSQSKIQMSNPNNTTQQQELISNTLFYFAKDIGLIRYSSEKNGELFQWELLEIRKMK